jgi:hypothetical protein
MLYFPKFNVLKKKTNALKSQAFTGFKITVIAYQVKPYPNYFKKTKMKEDIDE